MTPDEAIRFLALMGVEYAQTFAAAGQPVVQETLLIRVNAAAEVLRAELAKDGRRGDSQG